MASSSSIYGNNEKTPFSENDPVDKPLSPYAASKKAAELLCYTYSTLYQFDIFCMRFFTVYGPRQRPEMAIHQFVRRILNSDKIYLFGDGSSRRDYTYVDDIVQGLVNVLDHLKGYEIINLGESQPVALKDLINKIESVLNKQAIIEWMPGQPGDTEITYADISKAQRLIDYKPEFSLEKGLKNFVEWLIANKTNNN
jgi:UDP-glucuronate 4-epimerase